VQRRAREPFGPAERRGGGRRCRALGQPLQRHHGRRILDHRHGHGDALRDADADAPGVRHGPASATSSTAAASGQIQLVTPILISTNSPNPTIPAFGVLTLHFVPEPGTFVLLGLGVAALVRAGAQRRSARG
jgi:hypothetical protein